MKIVWPKAFSIFSQLRNSFLAVIVLIQLLLITLSVLFGRMTIEVLEQSENENLKNVIQNVSSAITSGIDGPKIAVISVSKDIPLLAAFARHDREALLKEASPIFEDLKKLGFKQFQFHIPQGFSYVTFLRVHHPEKFGEDLAYRPWKEAIEALDDLLMMKPNDKATIQLRERCIAFKLSPPPEKWRGEFVYS